MPRRKKKTKAHRIGKGIIYFLKGVWWLVRETAFGVKWVALKTVNSLRKQKEKSQARIVEKKRPKINAEYSPFEEVEKIQGSLDKFEQKLITMPSAIGIILGARGTGKSAIGLKILENIKAKTKKNVYAMGFNTEDIPLWINSIDSIDQIENNSVVLLDEGGIQFSSRRSMSDANKILSDILLIARHKDLSVLFISQNSANLEINALRQADYLIMKPSSLLQKDFERKKIKELYVEMESLFEKHKNRKGLTYIHSDEYRGFITNQLPSFWSTKVSKAFSGFNTA